MTNDEGMTKSEIVRGDDDGFGKIALFAKNRKQGPFYDLEERTARFGEAIAHHILNDLRTAKLSE